MGRPSRLITWPRLKDGEPWSPTDLARPRTVSSPTSWLASALARSRPGPPAGPRGWPSTTSSSGSRRSWAQTPSTQEQSSEKEFDLINKIVKHKLTKNINQITEVNNLLFNVVSENW